MRHNSLCRSIMCLAVLFLLPLWASSAIAGMRVALVMGNSNYNGQNGLANPANDAEDVSKKLTELGFDVIVAKDVKSSDQTKVLRDFIERLSGAQVGLFYYAGHAMQIDGQNYLIPVDARLEKATDISFDTLSLQTVIDLMQKETKTNLVFLDACRNNPFANQLARSMGQSRAIGMGRGLARTESGLGTMIAYATQPGSIASDGTGRNSPFASAFLKHSAEQGLEIRQVMTRVRADVVSATGGEQVPWDHSSLLGDFYLLPGTANPPPTPNVSETKNAFDIAYWAAISNSTVASDFQTYLDKFPGGQFVELARARLSDLTSGKTDDRPRGFTGFSSRLPTSTEIDALGVTSRGGLIVNSVAPKSKAEEAGIRPGQYIASINGTSTERVLLVGAMLDSLKAGDPLSLEMRLPDGATQTIAISAAAAEDLDNALKTWAENRIRLYQVAKKGTLFSEANNKSKPLMKLDPKKLVLSVEGEDGTWVKVLAKGKSSWGAYDEPAGDRFGYVEASILKEAPAAAYVEASQDILLTNLNFSLREIKDGRGYSVVYGLAARARTLEPNNVNAKISYAQHLETPVELYHIVDKMRSYKVKRQILSDILQHDPDNAKALTVLISSATEWDILDKETAISAFEHLQKISQPDELTKIRFYDLTGDDKALKQVYDEAVAQAKDNMYLASALMSRSAFSAKAGQCDDMLADMSKIQTIGYGDALATNVKFQVNSYIPCFARFTDKEIVKSLISQTFAHKEQNGSLFDIDDVFALGIASGDVKRALNFIDHQAELSPQESYIGFKRWFYKFLQGEATTDELKSVSKNWIRESNEAKLFMGLLTPEAYLAVNEANARNQKGDVDPWVWYLLGAYYDRNGQKEEAKQYLERAVSAASAKSYQTTILYLSEQLSAQL